MTAFLYENTFFLWGKQSRAVEPWVKSKSTATNDRFRNCGNTHRSQGCQPDRQGFSIFFKHKGVYDYSES